MRHSIFLAGVVAIGVTSAVPSPRAQQAPIPLRDFAMGGGNYYLRVPEFVDGSKATFLKEEDRVIGVTGDGAAKAYLAAAVTWHHGIEDRIGRLPIFVTW